MQLTHNECVKLFIPMSDLRAQSMQTENVRFAHYTSADAAYKIIKSNQVWMRNAVYMNDFSEITYGKNCFFDAYNSPEVGGRLRQFINHIYPELMVELDSDIAEWIPRFEEETYLTSLSEHEASGDELGKLSMWRAYAPKNGVAFIIKSEPFRHGNRNLGAYTSPVLYADPIAFTKAFNAQITNITAHGEVIRKLPSQHLKNWLFSMFKIAILCTKHPGFREEREWRIIYSPTQDLSEVITKDTRTIGGVPQQIHKIPLQNNPDNGLYRADINNLLDRIIIGPSEDPKTLRKTFISILEDAGIADACDRVVMSSIPLWVS